jgi:hypothetical protein
MLGRLVRRAWVAALLGIGAGSPAEAAVPSDSLFATVTIEGSALAGIDDDQFQSFWDTGLGGEIAALAPVPHGFLEIAAHPFSNAPRDDSLPRVRTLATWIGWGVDLPIARRVLLRASARTGVTWMLYDATAASPEQDENELAFGARATVHVPLGGAWSVQAGLRASRTLTHEPIDFVFAGGGVAYTFATPGWLRRFLE